MGGVVSSQCYGAEAAAQPAEEGRPSAREAREESRAGGNRRQKRRDDGEDRGAAGLLYLWPSGERVHCPIAQG